MEKLKIRYTTKEKVYNESKTVYSHVTKDVELTPLAITRSPVGRNGAGNSRYYYQGIFEAPEDAYGVVNKTIKEHINRKNNPKFNPKNYYFTDNYCGADYGDSELQ